METLREALERLEGRGFEHSFRAQREGLLAFGDDRVIAPEDLEVDEVVRFEGESDPQDSAVLFALRARDGSVRGTFLTMYGPQADPQSVAVLERLDAAHEHGQRASS